MSGTFCLREAPNQNINWWFFIATVNTADGNHKMQPTLRQFVNVLHLLLRIYNVPVGKGG